MDLSGPIRQRFSVRLRPISALIAVLCIVGAGLAVTATPVTADAVHPSGQYVSEVNPQKAFSVQWLAQHPDPTGTGYARAGGAPASGLGVPTRPVPSAPVPVDPTTTTTTSASGSSGSPPAAAAGPWRGAGLISLPADCSDIQTLTLSWYYNWETTTPCPNVGVPYVPMVWGDWCAGSSTCSALPASLGDSGNQYLLGFNEPDNVDQSNMTVARALQLWPDLEATGLQLGSPAVTETTQGSAWLAAFMAGARQQGLRVNFLALHWYGDCSNPQNLITYLAQMEQTYGLPLWLTEFSCIGQSFAVNAQFLQAVAPLLAGLPYLQRYAWFTNRPYSGAAGYDSTNLLDASGALTPIGEVFNALPER
jgi:hypothetical protein